MYVRGKHLGEKKSRKIYTIPSLLLVARTFEQDLHTTGHSNETCRVLAMRDVNENIRSAPSISLFSVVTFTSGLIRLVFRRRASNGSIDIFLPTVKRS
jgi:hypothetical protein